MEAPKCRLCQRNHWLSVACNGQNHMDTQREGRRVLKGSTGKPAKPTRTASTEKADPAKAMKAKGGEHPAPEPADRDPGATARPARKKAKKKGRKK